MHFSPVDHILPDCPIEELHRFMELEGWDMNKKLCTGEREVWENGDKTTYVEIPRKDFLPYYVVSVIVEGKMRKPLHAVDFYYRQIQQRFSPD